MITPAGNMPVSWVEIKDKPNVFPTQEHTHDFADLTNTPSIPEEQVNTDWNSDEGVTQLLNKPGLAAVATSGSYNDLSDKPSIPTVRRVETFLGTTNASGDYIVSYTTPYPSVPDVQPALQSSAPATNSAKITASTVNGFTINVSARNSANLLGVEVLLASTTPVNGASVSVLVTARE